MQADLKLIAVRLYSCLKIKIILYLLEKKQQSRVPWDYPPLCHTPCPIHCPNFLAPLASLRSLDNTAAKGLMSDSPGTPTLCSHKLPQWSLWWYLWRRGGDVAWFGRGRGWGLHIPFLLSIFPWSPSPVPNSTSLEISHSLTIFHWNHISHQWRFSD